MKYGIAYVVAVVIFLVFDALWIGVIAKSLYADRIGSILLDQPRWGVAVLFYAIYLVGLLYFAVSTGFNGGGVSVAAMNGALFGFFAYFTYSATNLAVMKGYDSVVAVADTVWGALLGAIVAGATVYVVQRFFPNGVG